MKISTGVCTAALISVGVIAGLVAYQFGLEKGRTQGEAVQQERSKLAHAQNTAVYLTMAAREEKAGQTSAADRTRYLLLYGSAMDMQDAIDSGKLSPAELSKWPPGPVLSAVAEHFHRHPESVTLIEETISTRHLVPDLRKLMERYDPAKQAPSGP